MPLTPLARRSAAAAVTVIALALAGVSVATSGAWFTATTTASASVEGATLSIGEIGVESDEETVHVDGVYPMTDSQALSGGAAWQWITVRNTGTIPLAWTLDLARAAAIAPLEQADLANFRYVLTDDGGTPVTSPSTFDAVAQRDGTSGQLYRGDVIPARSETRLRLAVWLTPESTDRFQGGSVTFTAIVNGMQSGAPRVPTLAPVQLTADRAGTPDGSATQLAWTEASSPDLAIDPNSVTYTVERSRNADFSDATVVYTGPARTNIDTTGAALGTATDIATSNAGFGNDSTYVVIGGSVYGWGKLITGGTGSSVTAIAGFPSDVVKIAAGSRHLCAITASDRVFCAGDDNYGQRGDGVAGGPTTAGATEIAATAVLSGKDLVDIAASENSTCVLAADADIACWGDNRSLQLGLWETRPSQRATPTLVATSSGERYSLLTSGRTTAIVGGGSNFCAVKTDGLICWGSTAFGQLSATYTPSPNYSAALNTPTRFPGTDAGVTDASVGWQSICAVTAAKSVRCAGHYNHGSFGNGDIGTGGTGSSGTATGQYDHVVSGQSHVCGWNETSASCWGWGRYGQLGAGDTTTVNASPRAVTALGSGQVVAMSAGYDTTCALLRSGAVQCFGNNASKAITGAAPTTAVTTVSTPASVAGLDQVGCAGGAVAGAASCSLEPGTEYHYRVSYTGAGLAAGHSPTTAAVRPR
ncbi:hypothetical protein [Herbiconiux sp. L3-i23]|uniref:RCC1 domain-containing protein n=1 Tax=Herbiconiux sp. L3-i23 TaxID=2905871 RepID=UPI00206E8CE8|nr:hypothetical protein [Herbiconiux sp. L3-i23]BDI23886.1 hypothetical protein L3i23_26620 [Herbiconiux sp. L3-i23]